MKKPNYGQQQKMKKMDPIALTQYCKDNGFEVPQMSVDTTPLQKAVGPEMYNGNPVVTPVSDHEHEMPKYEGHPPEMPKTETVGSSSVITEVEVKEPEKAVSEPVKEVSEADPMLVASRQFFALKTRLEQNAAHSVLNWDEMADLEATLFPFYKEKVETPLSPKVPSLPDGQWWALVVGEPINKTQKLIRFMDDTPETPLRMLYVNMSAARMMGRKLRVKKNPNENQGGYIVA